MTKTEFNAQFGTEWAKFSSRPIFKALMELLNDQGPIGKVDDMTPGDIVVGGHVLYAEVRGFLKARKLMLSISDPEPSELPPADYRGDHETETSES